jgi:RNA polymerase sigma-70 factor (ECF subfamily)
MARAAAGEAGAFRALWDRHGAPLHRFILRQVRRPTVAQELLQETFLRAYRGAGRYQPRAAVSAWLFRIAANLCANHTEAASSRHELLSEPPERADPGPGPAEQLQQAELSAAVEAALAALPAQQRTAVQLARFEELSYAEIAEILGVSVAAVDGLLQRARQTLRDHLRHLA